MTLISVCDNCEHDWRVDRLIFIEAVDKNCCPVCINQLVDMLVGTCSETTWKHVKKTWEEE